MLEIGSRVRVTAGDYTGALGTIESACESTRWYSFNVRLDVDNRQTRIFDALYVEAWPPAPEPDYMQLHADLRAALDQLHAQIMTEGIRWDGAWDEEVVTELMTQFFDAQGYDLNEELSESTLKEDARNRRWQSDLIDPPAPWEPQS
jgi:hypothetical protein